MNAFSHVPPGFRFHPTDEELVDYYLRKKLASRKIDLDVIKEIDLYKIEPWDLQEKCRIGTEEENEWYFFSHKDKKYPTGTRTNRATTAGFWKATGRDKPIYSKRNLVGMRKTLVYYKGRAPNGQKSDWIIHEYRVETNINGNPQEEGWVVCRVFRKRMAMVQRNHDPTCWYDERISLNNNIPDLESPENNNLQYPNYNINNSCKQETEQLQLQPLNFHQHHLPQLESSMIPTYINIQENSTSLLQNPPLPLVAQEEEEEEEAVLQPDNLYHLLQQQHPPPNTFVNSNGGNSRSSSRNVDDHVTDWRLLDKFVASQLSQDDEIIDGRRNLPNNAVDDVDDVFQVNDEHELGQTLSDLASTSASGCQIDLWK